MKRRKSSQQDLEEAALLSKRLTPEERLVAFRDVERGAGSGAAARGGRGGLRRLRVGETLNLVRQGLKGSGEAVGCRREEG